MTEQTTGQNRAKLYRKIADVTAEIGRIPKNGENKFHGYKYATESDITDALRELLKAHGLAFLPPSVLEWQRDEVVDNPKVGPRTRVKMQFELACCDTGEVYTAQMWGEGQDTGDKGFYKSYTGAVKYFLMKTFLIATGDDPERDDQAHEQPRPTQRLQPKTQQPAPAAAKQAPYDPAPARSAIAALPGATAEDIAAAADLDDKALLGDLYRQVRDRGKNSNGNRPPDISEVVQTMRELDRTTR